MFLFALFFIIMLLQVEVQKIIVQINCKYTRKWTYCDRSFLNMIRTVIVEWLLLIIIMSVVCQSVKYIYPIHMNCYLFVRLSGCLPFNIVIQKENIWTAYLFLFLISNDSRVNYWSMFPYTGQRPHITNVLIFRLFLIITKWYELLPTM